MDAEPLPLIQMLVLERVDRSCNMHRFYVLSLCPTLFGDVALRREWGGIGKPGRSRQATYDLGSNAREALETWLRRKQKRGYRPVLVRAE